jgi:ribosomal subunit interface protein
MQIQVRTDNNIDGHQDLIEHVESVVSHAMSHFGDQITRVEVHLKDENSTTKSGAVDKRCAMEARPAGMKPIAVTHHADNIHMAVEGAADKLKRSLEHTLGKLASR